jgi:hypothetical protein
MSISALLSTSKSVWDSKIPVMIWLKKLAMTHSLVRQYGRFILKLDETKPYNIRINPRCNNPQVVTDVYAIYKWVEKNNTNCLSRFENPRIEATFKEQYEVTKIERDEWGDIIKDSHNERKTKKVKR